MFDTLRIKLFGRQPFAKVDDKTLERIIHREFGNRASEVKRKLQGVKSDTPKGKNRISAAIIKLAGEDINAIDNFIEISDNDFRDVLARAEYPGCFDLDFDRIKKDKMKQVYFADWKDYSNWLKKI
jgi:hypothetical protein